MISFLSEKIFSRGNGCELFDIRIARGQQRRDDFASVFRHDVAVRAADFAQQSMHPQQPQLAGDGAGSPLFLLVRSGFGPELSAQVAVAQAVDRVFAPAHRRQQGRVFFAPRVESAMTSFAFDHSPANAGAGLAHRGFVCHAGQSLEITPVGGRRHFGPPPQLAHAALHRSPRLFSAGVALFGAVDFELFGFVDGRFDPQDAAFFVIHLD